jgi:hypothetical protein
MAMRQANRQYRKPVSLGQERYFKNQTESNNF